MKEQPYGTVSPFSRPATADKVLDQFFDMTRELKIKAFLMYGLCLGFYRDGGYINGDNDLDVGVICSERKRKKLLASLKEGGFTQGELFRRNMHFHKDRILVDLHFRESNGGLYSTLKNIGYKDKEYPAPHPIEPYLAACYRHWERKTNRTRRRVL
ncbi:MAG: hypothetical protein GTN53_46080 [Candidatus Aminicenantes bacterium]|nr:hypothetical protein [Candidatus Aminicenantes bacterium]NIQ73780.1 hypothetical protein [Candidatus Aminicenantes bacterium]NIT29881.1 hypothetical protein [Candidatus Aminicenantes bacterium]